MRSRAAILHDVGGNWSVEEFELDPPRAGEVLVEMAAAGLCHTDDHILTGDMSVPNEVMRSLGRTPMFPTIGGHEGSATVREIGSAVTDFAVGDHVVMSFVAVCGQCRWCASGMEYICDAGMGTMTTIFGSCNARADIARLVRLYQTGQLQLDEMITRRYRLDDINDAYRDLHNGEIVRGIIDFAAD